MMNMEFIRVLHPVYAVALQIYCGDEVLRMFWKPWGLPYWYHQWGYYGFGAGPVGCMFWSAKGRESA